MKTLVKNFIGGKWVGAHSGRTFDSRDPATGEVVGRCVDSGPEDIDEAVKAATEAFESWRRMPAPRRGGGPFPVAQGPGGGQGEPGRHRDPGAGRGVAWGQ